MFKYLIGPSVLLGPCGNRAISFFVGYSLEMLVTTCTVLKNEMKMNFYKAKKITICAKIEVTFFFKNKAFKFKNYQAEKISSKYMKISD